MPMPGAHEKRRPWPGGACVFGSTAIRINAMQIGQNAPADKAARNRLPNRRAAETIASEHAGAGFSLTAGYYPDGRVGEVFLNADRANSLLDFLMSDAAILASLA